MNILIDKKRLFLALLAFVSLLMGYGISQLGIDFSFDRFYPKEEPEVAFYERYKATFPHYDNSIQIAFKNGEKDVFDASFLSQVDTLFEQFGSLENIDTLISPTRLKYFRRSGLGVSEKALLKWDSPEALAKSRKRVAEDSLLYFNFFSEDKSYIAGIILLEPEILDLAVRDTLVHKLDKILQRSELEHVVSGIPYIRTQYVEKIKSELIYFIGLSILLTIVILFLTYRSFWGIWVPMTGVLTGLIWAVGFMGITGKDIDLLIELLPPIMFVVGTSDVIHLITKYIQELKKGLDRREAMRVTISEIGAAIFLTSLTTAIGFASLFISPLPPVKEFGLFAAAGVLFAWAISVILVPNVLLTIPKERLIKSRGVGNIVFWDKLLMATYRFTKNKAKWIWVGFVVFISISIWGVSQISFNSYLLDDISPQDPTRQSMAFFEDNFYGMRPFEMSVTAKNGKEITDLEILRDLDKIEDFVRGQTRMSPALSPSSFIKNANRLYKGGRDRFYRLPSSQEKVDELLAFGIVSGGTGLIGQILDSTRTQGRISARMPDVGTDSSIVIQARLHDFIARECNTDNFDYHLTGTAILTELNVQYLRESLFSGLILAFLLIAVIMGFLFRSWRMLLIGVFPNMIPLLFTAGVMGFAGISLKASTSIIFLVAFGIAVDDTIHFLSRLRLELRAGRSLEGAIQETLMGTGKALVLTTLVLLAGFILLLSSDFGGTYIVGLFTGVTLLVALISDLLLLPVLVRAIGLKGSEAETEEATETEPPIKEPV